MTSAAPSVGEVASPKRIGLIIGQLSVGGAEGQLYELLRAIDRSRFEPIVYSLAASPGALRSRLEATGVRVQVIGSVGPERVRRLARAVRADGVELIHAWLFIANTYAWLARTVAARLPLVTSARNCKSQGPVHHVFNALAFRGSARIVVNSTQVRDYIVRTYRAPAPRVQVVYNGVDVDRFHVRGASAADGPLVIGAGRLVAQKNFMLFLEAAALVHREIPQARFRIVGEGPQREVLTERIRALQMEGAVELVGERQDLDSLLRAADVFWLTSAWEGLPNVVLEAMASGLPVVATDVGGVRELVRSGREGFLVRAGHAAELAAYGVALLRDPALRAATGAAAICRARQFSLRRMVAGMESVYDHVLAETA